MLTYDCYVQVQVITVNALFILKAQMHVFTIFICLAIGIFCQFYTTTTWRGCVTSVCTKQYT